MIIEIDPLLRLKDLAHVHPEESEADETFRSHQLPQLARLLEKEKRGVAEAILGHVRGPPPVPPAPVVCELKETTQPGDQFLFPIMSPEKFELIFARTETETTAASAVEAEAHEVAAAVGVVGVLLDNAKDIPLWRDMSLARSVEGTHLLSRAVLHLNQRIHPHHVTGRSMFLTRSEKREQAHLTRWAMHPETVTTVLDRTGLDEHHIYYLQRIELFLCPLLLYHLVINITLLFQPMFIVTSSCIDREVEYCRKQY